MRNLELPIRSKLMDLIDGAISVRSFQSWYAEHLWDAENYDDATKELLYSIELLLSERDAGHRTPKQFKNLLRDLVGYQQILRIVENLLDRRFSDDYCSLIMISKTPVNQPVFVVRGVISDELVTALAGIIWDWAQRSVTNGTEGIGSEDSSLGHVHHPRLRRSGSGKGAVPHLLPESARSHQEEAVRRKVDGGAGPVARIAKRKTSRASAVRANGSRTRQQVGPRP